MRLLNTRLFLPVFKLILAPKIIHTRHSTQKFLLSGTETLEPTVNTRLTFLREF